MTHSPSPGSMVSMLAHFHKIPIQMGHAVKRDMLFLANTHLGISHTKKINVAAVNIDQSFV